MRSDPFSKMDDDLRELVRRAAAIELAPRGARARVLAGVQAAVTSPGGGREGSPSVGPDPSSVGVRARVVERGVAVAVGFLLGGVVGALVTYRTIRPREVVEPALLASVDRRASMAVTEGPTPSTSGIAASAPVGAKASVVRPDTPYSAPAAPHPPPAPAASPDALAEERRLLDAARGAIEREDGPAALVATAEHARKYPDGVLVQEREAIAVRALLLVGRTAEARRRLEHFRASFPDSLLLPAIESSVAAASAE